MGGNILVSFVFIVMFQSDKKSHPIAMTQLLRETMAESRKEECKVYRKTRALKTHFPTLATVLQFANEPLA